MSTRPDTLQGSLPLLVLTVLERRGPLHGYAITAHIHGLSDVLRIEEGSLYPALHRMEEAGWVKARTITTSTTARRAPTASPPPGAGASRSKSSAGGPPPMP
jgi:PadR family transcriptional regulator, regulatory protein PadR